MLTKMNNYCHRANCLCTISFSNKYCYRAYAVSYAERHQVIMALTLTVFFAVT